MKYELTTNTKTVNGITLHQIRALKDFGKVKAGDLGGWIEKEENLSQYANAWVSGSAWVFGSARVFGDAQVFGDAWVFGKARVFGDARVSDNAQVSGDAWVSDNAQVSGNARVSYNINDQDKKSSKTESLPEILSTLPKEVSSITISGKTYKLINKTISEWVLQD
jgi:hypothetical protein